MQTLKKYGKVHYTCLGYEHSIVIHTVDVSFYTQLMNFINKSTSEDTTILYQIGEVFDCIENLEKQLKESREENNTLRKCLDMVNV